jgi:hypothetical protein
MANWKNTIDLTRVWEEAQDTPKLLVEVCKDIIRDLNKITNLDEEHLDIRDDIVWEFNELVENECEDYNEFNDLLGWLYDFGDTKLDDKFAGDRIAWIKTKF